MALLFVSQSFRTWSRFFRLSLARPHGADEADRREGRERAATDRRLQKLDCVQSRPHRHHCAFSKILSLFPFSSPLEVRNQVGVTKTLFLQVS